MALCDPVLPGFLNHLRWKGRITAAWKKRICPVNPTQDPFKAAVISSYPTTKCFYSSLRHIDADWVLRHCIIAEDEDLCVCRGGLAFSVLLSSLPDSSRWDLGITAALERAVMLIHSECEPVTPTCTSHTTEQHPPLTLPHDTHQSHAIIHLGTVSENTHEKCFLCWAALLHPPSSTLSFFF